MRLIKVMLMVAIGGAAVPATADDKSLYTVDLQTIKTQMEVFYLDSSRFTTIENLDDTQSGTPSRPWQAIGQGGGTLTILPNEGFPRRQTLPQWFGPYISWSSSRDYETSTGDYNEGAPLDLNGVSSIYFYTPLGLVEPRADDLSLRYYGDEIGEYAIVTHGANGVFDGNLTSSVAGDDVIVTIPGFQVTIPAVSSARRSPLITKSGGWTLVVKGRNFGANSGQAAVLVDSVPAGGSVVEWTPSRIELSLPSEVPLGAVVTVRLAGGGIAARSVEVINANVPSRCPDWLIY